MVAANSAIVDHDVPSPKSDGIPLFDFKSRKKQSQDFDGAIRKVQKKIGNTTQMLKGEKVSLYAVEKEDLEHLRNWRNNPDFRKNK